MDKQYHFLWLEYDDTCSIACVGAFFFLPLLNQYRERRKKNIRSDENRTFEMSAPQTVHGGNSTFILFFHLSWFVIFV